MTDGDLAASLLALRVRVAALADEARAAGAIGLAERLGAATDLDAIQAALRAARAAGARVDALLVACGDLDEALVAAAERDRADAAAGLSPSPEAGVERVDVMPAGRQVADMSPDKIPDPPKPTTGKAWREHIETLVAARNDRELVELARGPRFAGTQEELARLSGLTEASISRGKTHGFSDATRAWFRGYLLDPAHPPAPLPHQPGRRPRAGAEAPVAWVTRADARAFEGAAKRCGVRPNVLLEWLMRRWCQEHARGEPPEVTTPRGPSRIRCRIGVEVLVAFDDRIGGAARRGEYLRVAIHEGLPALRGLRALPDTRPLPKVA